MQCCRQEMNWCIISTTLRCTARAAIIDQAARTGHLHPQKKCGAAGNTPNNIPQWLDLTQHYATSSIPFSPPAQPHNPRPTMSKELTVPITILTGFLGSGKTTIILNLLPQLPADYKLALLKNEFGDVAIDSQLASERAISGVRELLNGCICCNLVGQLGEALETLREEVAPDRIVIETSGSAFPATLAMEVNRLARETGHFALDGVISVIDVENWRGYEDTSYTAKMQAQYTDLVVFNKHELVDERRFDECLDRLGDIDIQTAWVRSDKGFVGKDLILGVDGALAKELRVEAGEQHAQGKHDHASDHQSEVEVLSVTLDSAWVASAAGVDVKRLEAFLQRAPKDEIYRIKAILFASSAPASSGGEKVAVESSESDGLRRYILNWAFGRWTFTPTALSSEACLQEPVLRMTIVTARHESGKWRKRIEARELLGLEGAAEEGASIRVERVS